MRDTIGNFPLIFGSRNPGMLYLQTVIEYISTTLGLGSLFRKRLWRKTSGVTSCPPAEMLSDTARFECFYACMYQASA